ncbi:hypothetical protein MtrunA17_Chr1g0152751 [Medicago truncatula]|uniref:Transmembrane protein, putative n=1 Tax=Medicago truncatula TaxID=3880 RepID=G7ICF0_MEDTR|nr:uncharacterized protein LOC25485767 [Medicago truncatula]AES59351.2 transmembrane protein, putative [Medicago truncatula]KEH40019.1 transmembrane protein, putative [Medicago truncatula]RHN77248.1 hypothetical protein MtrunA17_Chr1g0152751 [Medicago truncatula]
MKVSGFCTLFLMVVAAFTFFSFKSTTAPPWFPDFVATRCGDKSTPIAVSRKLKENFHSIKRKLDVGLDDYSPIDPSPDSGAKNVNPGPIEHGTPLNPYIPKPPPPSRGQDDYN